MYIGRVLEEKPMDMREFKPNNVADIASAYRDTLQPPGNGRSCKTLSTTPGPRPTDTSSR